MDERIQRSLNAVKDFKSLAQFEKNVRERVASMMRSLPHSSSARKSLLGR